MNEVLNVIAGVLAIIALMVFFGRARYPNGAVAKTYSGKTRCPSCGAKRRRGFIVCQRCGR